MNKCRFILTCVAQYILETFKYFLSGRLILIEGIGSNETYLYKVQMEMTNKKSVCTSGIQEQKMKDQAKGM